MSISVFFRRLLLHFALALSVWMALALGIERLVPGSISPFINLPEFGLGTFGVIMAAIGLSDGGSSHSSRLISLFVMAILLLAGGAFLWIRINEYGWRGIMLLVIGVVLSFFMGYRFWIVKEEGE